MLLQHMHMDIGFNFDQEEDDQDEDEDENEDEDHNYGFVTEIEPKVIIKGVVSGGFMPEPGDETIATFNSALDMVEAGWVLD